MAVPRYTCAVGVITVLAGIGKEELEGKRDCPQGKETNCDVSLSDRINPNPCLFFGVGVGGEGKEEGAGQG